MIGACLLAYNEQRYILPAIRQWRPHVDKLIVLLSSVPWNNIDDDYRDRTQELLHYEDDIEVHVRNWRSEAEQRNFGLEQLKDCDYVLTFDPDEFLTAKDIGKLLTRLKDPLDYQNAVLKPLPCFRADKLETYWRDFDHVLSPIDRHKPIIAVDPRQAAFSEHRQIPLEQIQTIPVVIHHLSWVRNDIEVQNKIRSFSHAGQVRPDWYKQKWLARAAKDVRPYGMEVSNVVSGSLPEEIRVLLKG